jgi:CubicO group peptidase (beta-lactamase class C family)
MFSVAALRDAHTLFAPGSRWSYSNDGFSTAGAILAALDGRTWEQSVQSRVFDRLGMSHTSAVFSAQTLADAASGYEFGDMNVLTPPQPRLLPIYPGEFVDPAGTVISTPEDMARYMRFLIDGGVNDRGERVVSSQSYALMTTPDDMDGKPAGPAAPELAEAPLLFQHYGFGLGLHDENGENYVAHTGGIGGYTACMETNVTRGYGVIAMSNLVEAPLHPCAIVLYAMQVLHAQALGEPIPAPPATPHGTYLQQTHLENADRLAGTYTNGDGGPPITITSDGSSLALAGAGGPVPLYARGGDTFWVDDPRFAIYGLTFVPGKNGAIEVFSGSQWFYNSNYTGPKIFSQPKDLALYAGRYEGEQLWGVSPASRVFALKGKLTVDGAPLLPQKDGTFKLGSSLVRFDTLAGGAMQRMWIDGLPMYRIDLP